jgi:hypothetical protein
MPEASSIHSPGLRGETIYSQVSRARPELAGRFVFMTGGAFTREAVTFWTTCRYRCSTSCSIRRACELWSPRGLPASDLAAVGLLGWTEMRAISLSS